MNIILTKWQSDMLKPFFDELEEEQSHGRNGAVLAQIYHTKENDHFMFVTRVDERAALAIQAATGMPEGYSIPDGEVQKVWAPVEKGDADGR